jgi:hypothetical protein
MKTQRRTAALSVCADLVPSKGNHANLRSAVAFSTPGVEVDSENGIIRGAAVMNVGPAVGHGFNIDLETLRQVEALGNATTGGVKVRFTHPGTDEDGQQVDDLGSVIGFVDNLRIEGDSLRGDVHIEEYAKLLPGKGNVRDYLLSRATKRPDSFGLSCVIGWDAEIVNDAQGQPASLVARVFALDAVDVVGRGAATPNGLLSQQTQQINSAAGVLPVANPTKPQTAAPRGAASSLKGRSLMDPKTKQYLSAKHGLAADATDEEAQAMLDALNPEDKAAMSAKLAEGDVKPTAQMAARKPTTDAGDEFLALEGKRVAQLQQLGNTLNVDKLVIQTAIAEGDDVIKGRTRYLKSLQETCKPVNGAITVGEDRNRTSLAAAIPDAIMLRASVKCEKPHERALQLRGLSLIDMAKQYFVSLGVPTGDVMYMSSTRVCDLLGPRRFAQAYPNIAYLAQSSSDFSSILADTINKTLRQSYLDAPRTWTTWARKTTAPDFKTISRTVLSEAPNMVSRDEGGEIKYVTLSDSKETYALVEYVNGIRLTRRALINDDLDAFSRIPMLQGNTAARLEDDTAYAIITANAALADTGLLFNATAVTTAGGHANYTSSGTALSVASLAVGETAMMVQKGPKNAARLELQAKFLLVPIAIKATAMQLINSTVDPSKSNAANNPYANKFTIIPSARLNDNSATAWYLMADYRDGQIDTVEVCFLAGEEEPVAKQETDFDTEDQKYAIRHTVAAKAIDFRGMYKNAGA